MIALDFHFTGTYARNLLSDWTIINNMMLERTLWVKETIEAQQAEAPLLDAELLSDRQFDDAFNGPFQHFFKQHLKSYAMITKVETALTISKEDFFKESEHVVDLTLGFSTPFLEKNDFSKLTAVRDQLNTATKEHYAQWEAQLQQWEAMILNTLKKNSITLTDMELQDFKINQPISEIEDRFVNLKLTIPKLKKEAFDFRQYLTLKITLAIQSVLSRQHLPSTDKEIEQHLKSLKHDFKAIHEAETTLLQTQQKALGELTKSIQFVPTIKK